MRRTLLISAALADVIALGFVGCQSARIQSGNDNGSPIIITEVAPYPIDNRLPAGDYSVELRHESAFRGNRPSYVEKSTVFWNQDSPDCQPGDSFEAGCANSDHRGMRVSVLH